MEEKRNARKGGKKNHFIAEVTFEERIVAANTKHWPII